jgi:hypothetical protein
VLVVPAGIEQLRDDAVAGADPADRRVRMGERVVVAIGNDRVGLGRGNPDRL